MHWLHPSDPYVSVLRSYLRCLDFGGQIAYPILRLQRQFVTLPELLTCSAMSQRKETPPQDKYSAQEGTALQGSLVDPSLEYTDPTPNIHVLFQQFNDRFFRGQLAAVEVKWSPRMTSNVGVCTYEEEDGLCTIRLSEPLLKLRPRKDLIETLLHEMIHAYLFLCTKDHDRSEHGLDFRRYMRRINRESGTAITVSHEFDDKAELYRQHWYSCDGPCHYWRPRIGTVMRYSRCPPGPRDSWWSHHQRLCGGKFHKVQGPGGYAKPASKD